MSLQGAWNTAFGSAIDVRKKIILKDGKPKTSAIEDEAQNIQSSPGQQGADHRSPEAATPMNAVTQSRLNALMNTPDATVALRSRMTNEEAAERAEEHLQESDTAQNNIGSVVTAMRSRSTRDKFRRQRELRRRREGKVNPNGTAAST